MGRMPPLMLGAALAAVSEAPAPEPTGTEFHGLTRAPGQTGTLRIQGVEIPVDPQRDTAAEIVKRAALLGYLMPNLPVMSALALAALADAPSARTKVSASQHHEENLMRCRVLARIFRLPTDDVQRQAAELDWDMHALQRKLEGPPKLIAGLRHVVIEVGPNETAAEVVRRRSDLFETVRALPVPDPCPTAYAPPRRRSKRAQRARRTIWTTPPSDTPGRRAGRRCRTGTEEPALITWRRRF